MLGVLLLFTISRNLVEFKASRHSKRSASVNFSQKQLFFPED